MRNRIRHFLKRANEDELLANLVAVIAAGLMFCAIAGIYSWLH